MLIYSTALSGGCLVSSSHYFLYKVPLISFEGIICQHFKNTIWHSIIKVQVLENILESILTGF